MHDLTPSTFGGLNDNSPAAVAARTAAQLDEAQQRLLLTHRTVLIRALTQKNDPKTIMDKYQSGIVGRPHFGTWDSFFPMIDGLYRLRPPTEPCIILGGWLRPPPTSLSGALPPPAALQEAARLRGIYGEARQLYSVAVPHSNVVRPTAWKQFTNWIDEHRNDFLAARRDDGELYYADIMGFTSKNITPLRAPIQDGLMFMANQALAFFSTPADPGQAWRDLWEFCLGYNSISDRTRDMYGPYYLLIVSHDALDALRKAAAAAALAAAPATTTATAAPVTASTPPATTPPLPQYPPDEQPL
jgi:hypothetical protein